MVQVAGEKGGRRMSCTSNPSLALFCYNAHFKLISDSTWCSATFIKMLTVTILGHQKLSLGLSGTN